MLTGGTWASVTSSCTKTVQRKICPYLTHNINEFIAHEDLNKTQDKPVYMSNKGRFNMGDLDNDIDLLISDKENLPTEYLI